MKKSTVLFMCLMQAGFLISCGNSSDKEENKEEKGAIEQLTSSVDAVQNLSKMGENAKAMEDRMNELKTMTPVSNDVLKAVLPETLGGLKRKNLSIGNAGAVNLSNASANYSNEDGSKTFDLEIMDGAGETASSIVSLMFLGLSAEREEITETGFEKIEDLGDNRAIVSEEKNGEIKDSKIQTIHDKRFLVNLNGSGIDLEELKTIFKSINLSSLK